MKTAGNFADRWMEHAYKTWFLQRPESYLKSSMGILVEKMRQASLRSDGANETWDLVERLLAWSDPAVCKNYNAAADAHMECGVAAYHIGNLHDASKYIYTAIEKYNNSHSKGIAWWMFGCVQWQTPGGLDKALEAWEQALSLFQELKRTPPPGMISKWYEDRVSEIQRAIRESADKSSPPDPASILGTAGVGKPHDETHTMRSWQILGNIPAGFAKGVAGVEIDRVLVDRIRISNQTYCINSLRSGEKEINIQRNQEYCALKVIGDSMNKLLPVPILDGDYVLIKAQETADPGDIVAAVIDALDSRSTLKQLVRQGSGFRLRAHSDNPVFDQPEAQKEFARLNDGFSIRGIAVAVFKPVDA
jgi:hypothetical protein